MICEYRTSIYKNTILFTDNNNKEVARLIDVIHKIYNDSSNKKQKRKTLK